MDTCPAAYQRAGRDPMFASQRVLGPLCCAGTPLWKLVLKQFDDLLVKVGPNLSLGRTCPKRHQASVQCG
eukprot:240401-Chlamydomonas_euryale.AAC.3